MNDFVPTLQRTHRRCSTPKCPHFALFFPVLEFLKNKNVAIEMSLQYCPHCMKKIKNVDDMTALCGSEVELDFSFDGAKPINRAGLDVRKAKVTWYPLIVGSESETRPVSPQRHHD